MSSGKKSEKKSKVGGYVGEGEVEELLRFAEDDLLLKLHVNAHTTTSSSSLDPDLARRLHALKSPPPPAGIPTSPTMPSSSKPVEAGGIGGGNEEEWRKILGDDLSARFAALKGPSEIPNNTGGFQQSGRIFNDGDCDDVGGVGDGDGVSNEKEVEKVMQWAMDAARLDPSKTDDDEEEDLQEEDDLPEEEISVKEKRISGKKGNPKKWFFF